MKFVIEFLLIVGIFAISLMGILFLLLNALFGNTIGFVLTAIFIVLLVTNLIVVLIYSEKEINE